MSSVYPEVSSTWFAHDHLAATMEDEWSLHLRVITNFRIVCLPEGAGELGPYADPERPCVWVEGCPQAAGQILKAPKLVNARR